MQLRMMDTLEINKILIAGGASRELAEAVTKVVKESHDLDLIHLATKGDIALLRADIALLRADFKEDIKNLKCIVGTQILVVLALGALLKYFMG